ncbi:hypothetical protein KKG52_02795 [Patescibacteria group bacterium]|nr:hypothetical protein [Patescibacteria group bacterium]
MGEKLKTANLREKMSRVRDWSYGRFRLGNLIWDPATIFLMRKAGFKGRKGARNQLAQSSVGLINGRADKVCGDSSNAVAKD